MKSFTWKNGNVVSGLGLVTDEKLGLVVLLGEEGRGRRYEKVGLDRREPAEVLDNRVLDAFPRKVVLPARAGKSEKTFYVLERPRRSDGWDLLVRVNAYSGYLKNGGGHWSVVAGEPEDLIVGHGAFGDAGRIGGWADGLVRMRPGDVLKVHPTLSIEGVSLFALWVSEEGELKTATWAKYETLRAVGKAEEVNVAFGQMPAMSYVGRGEFQRGIAVKPGITGPCVILGEEGRGRREIQVAIVGFEPGERIEEASVAKVSEERAIWGIAQSQRQETGAALVRVHPNMSNRVHRRVDVVRGNPTSLAAGRFASGSAGGMDSSPDELWIMRPGDSLGVASYTNPGWVIENVGGAMRSEPAETWQARDAITNPEPYLAKGRATLTGVPAAWIGRVVTVRRFAEDQSRMWLEQTHEGELISADNGRLTLNLGWDGRDRRVVVVDSGLWVCLETEKTVTVPDAARVSAKAEAASLRAEAESIRGEGYFKCLESGTQALVGKVAEGRSEWSRGNDSAIDFDAVPTSEISGWAEWAKGIMSQVREARPAACELHRRQTGGEVLANFEAWKRRGGSTNCGDGWVVRKDGSLREPDSMECPRPRYSDEGTQHWDLVASDELAIVWGKNCTAAPHEFTVAKRPVGELTEAQLATVEGFERALAKQWDGAVGLSGRTTSPPVGNGWNLRPAPKAVTPAEKGPAVDAKKLDFTGMFGGAVQVSSRRR